MRHEVIDPDKGTATINEPWWVMEGYVVAAGTYSIIDFDEDAEAWTVLTTNGQARLLEPARGVEPTASSAML